MLEMRSTEPVEEYDLCPEGYEYDEMAMFTTPDGVEAACLNAARACARGEECDPMFFMDTDCCVGGAEETTKEPETTEASQCMCYAEIQNLVENLRSDLQREVGALVTEQLPAGIEAAFQDMGEELSSTLRPIITEEIPAGVEQALMDMSSELSEQLTAALEPIFLSIENFQDLPTELREALVGQLEPIFLQLSNIQDMPEELREALVEQLQPIFLQLQNFQDMPEELREALTTNLQDQFVPISALQTIFESLEESLQTSLGSVLTENFVSKDELRELPTELAESLQEGLSPYFMALVDLEDLENLDVNLGTALAETLPNVFATKEEVDALSATVSMLEMDNNEVMTGMSDMASCMADIAGSMGSDDGSDDSSEDGSDDTPVETAAPTEYWETLGRMMESGPNKCSTSSSDRAFRLTFTTLDNCLKRCSDDSRCRYASTNFMTGSDPMYCIGCINLTQTADDWMAYEMLNNRRQLSSVKQLSEVERLRAENQRLRAELAEARRN